MFWNAHKTRLPAATFCKLIRQKINKRHKINPKQTNKQAKNKHSLPCCLETRSPKDISVPVQAVTIETIIYINSILV